MCSGGARSLLIHGGFCLDSADIATKDGSRKEGHGGEAGNLRAGDGNAAAAVFRSFSCTTCVRSCRTTVETC